MNFADVEAAVKAAKDTIALVDGEVKSMVLMTAGRLRAATQDSPSWSSTADALKKLKAELRGFDSRTGVWKPL